ncbi:MAG: 5-formyltetrahydrofolate cyclo-ligase [Proteobacteria bacterium]|nr:5-formyltetrahydrofolate cyclo-ligase [Pseudomonadota bacterium]
MNPFPPHPEKSALRRSLRQQRAALLPLVRQRAELQAARQAKANGWLRPGKRIAAYIPVGSEFSPWPLILLALHRGVEVYLPQVPARGRQLRFVRFDEHSRWVEGQYGIPELLSGQSCLPRQLDSVFLPLLGFDASGGRLGQGGGYYDATFAFRRNRRHWKKPRLIGLAFACQQVEALPKDHWDLHLDAVLPGAVT